MIFIEINKIIVFLFILPEYGTCVKKDQLEISAEFETIKLKLKMRNET